jgi:DNA-binding NarL/FixJ family response regulator
VQNIMGKLHVHSKLEAVAFALRHRLVEPPRAE